MEDDEATDDPLVPIENKRQADRAPKRKASAPVLDRSTINRRPARQAAADQAPAQAASAEHVVHAAGDRCALIGPRQAGHGGCASPAHL